MPWRNWSIVVVLILCNYLVFSLLGNYAFPTNLESRPTPTIQPTFTPGGERALTRVAPLSYPFLTATITATLSITGTRPAITPTFQAPGTITATFTRP